MDKKPTEIHETLIHMKINKHIVQYKLSNKHKQTLYCNWPVILAASQLNSGYTSSYALIRICYVGSHSNA